MHKFKTFAKVNLFLHIVGKRPDGYHLLESIFYFPEISDDISFEESDKTSLKISGRFSSSLESSKDNNLIIESFDELKKSFPKLPELSFHLVKNLPVSAGIGGGSSNAAGVLRELNKFYKLGLSDSELYNIGAGIGADVPACILSKPCFVSGIGENISEIKNFPKLNILLVNPLISVSTAEIFQHGFDIKTSCYSGESQNLLKMDTGLRQYDKDHNNDNKLNLLSFLKEARNDLYDNAIKICPEIKDIIDILSDQKGCEIARMSGSGATCFGIFDSAENLETARKYISAQKPNYWVA